MKGVKCLNQKTFRSMVVPELFSAPQFTVEEKDIKLF